MESPQNSKPRMCKNFKKVSLEEKETLPGKDEIGKSCKELFSKSIQINTRSQSLKRLYPERESSSKRLSSSKESSLKSQTSSKSESMAESSSKTQPSLKTESSLKTRSSLKTQPSMKTESSSKTQLSMKTKSPLKTYSKTKSPLKTYSKTKSPLRTYSKTESSLKTQPSLRTYSKTESSLKTQPSSKESSSKTQPSSKESSSKTQPSSKESSSKTDSMTESSSKTQPVYCYTCDSTVKGDEIFNHLFFGQLQCERCSGKILTCREFSSKYHSDKSCPMGKDGTHAYTKWIKDTLMYIQYYVHKDLIIKKFCGDSNIPSSIMDVNQLAVNYIRRLSDLKLQYPWKLAFSKCQYFMNPKKFPNHCLENETYLRTTTSSPDAIRIGTRSETKALIKFNKDLRLKQLDEPKNDKKECNKSNNICNIQKTNMATTTNKLDNIQNVHQKTNLTQTTDKSDNVQNVAQTTNPALTTNRLDNIRNVPQKTNLATTTNKSDNIQNVPYNTNVAQTTNKSDNVQNVPQQTNPASTTNKSHIIQNVSHKTNLVLTTNKLDNIQNVPQKANPASTTNKSENIPNIPQNAETGVKCLIVNYPREKCPDMCPRCDCALSIDTLTFNCTKIMMKSVCRDCGFPIYIKPDLNTRATFRKRLIM